MVMVKRSLAAVVVVAVPATAAVIVVWSGGSPEPRLHSVTLGLRVCRFLFEGWG